MTGVTTFTQEKADSICELISEGNSLRKICAMPGMPNKATVFKWLADIEGFSDQYAHARNAQADHLFEELAEVAEAALQAETAVEVNARRLIVDTHKWRISKMLPKKYGDFKAVELTGANGGPVVIQATAVDERI